MRIVFASDTHLCAERPRQNAEFTALLDLIRDWGAELYLLGDVDVPFVEDPIRYLPGARAAFFERSAALLAERGRRVVILRGGWEARWRTAVDAVDALLAEG